MTAAVAPGGPGTPGAEPGRVLAVGGINVRDADGVSGFHRLAVELAGADRPRVVFLPTASGDSPEVVVGFYAAFTRLDCRPEHVELFGAPRDPAARVAEADVVWVAGGNTANMLALWRLHGIDAALRHAWERGAVLAGFSAGANCWFQGSVTDSFGPELGPLSDGLGLVAGSFCPHFDGEALRRPRYLALVRSGQLPPGIACDDDAGALFVGSSLREIVATRPEARAARITTSGETPLPARVLASG